MAVQNQPHPPDSQTGLPPSSLPGSQRNALAALTLAVTAWGLAPVITRHLVETIPPIPLITIRLTLSAILFLPVLLRIDLSRWTRADVVLLIFCSMTGIVGYYLPVTIASQWIGAGITGLVIASEPIWIIVLLVVFFKDKLGVPRITGLVITIIGILLLIGGRFNVAGLGVPGDHFVVGTLLTLLGVLLWSSYAVFVRSINRKHGVLICTALITIIGTLPILPAWNQQTVSIVSHLSAEAWASFLLLAAGSAVLGALLWNYGLTRVAGAQGALFLYAIPLISVLGGDFFLGEALTPGVILSGLLIIGGVAVAQIRQSE